jgi:type I restriction enzyme M protein
VVEDPEDKSKLEPYYTPSALLQNKSESIKWFDLTKADSKQSRMIEKKLRLESHEILISRSGSIGRVIYVTNRFKGIIASDDFVKVRVPDENLRYYVYYYLRSRAGQDQMKKNEYGSIQQHLEPSHIKKLLIPIPDDLSKIKGLIDQGRSTILAQENADKKDNCANESMSELLSSFGIVASRDPLVM